MTSLFAGLKRTKTPTPTIGLNIKNPMFKKNKSHTFSEKKFFDTFSSFDDNPDNRKNVYKVLGKKKNKIKDQSVFEVELDSKFPIKNNNLENMDKMLKDKKKIDFDKLDKNNFNAALSALELLKLKQLTIKQRKYMGAIETDESKFYNIVDLKNNFVKSQVKGIFDEDIEKSLNTKIIRTYFEEEVILNLETASTTFETFKKKKDEFIKSLKENINFIKEIGTGANKNFNINDYKTRIKKNTSDDRLMMFHIILEELDKASKTNKNIIKTFLKSPQSKTDDLIDFKLEIENELIKRKKNFFKFYDDPGNPDAIFGISNNKKLNDYTDEFEYEGFTGKNKTYLDSEELIKYFEENDFKFANYEIFGEKVPIKTLRDIHFSQKLEVSDYIKKLDPKMLEKRRLDEVIDDELSKKFDEFERKYIFNENFSNTLSPSPPPSPSPSPSPSSIIENYIDKILISTLMKEINKKKYDNKISLFILVKNIYDNLNENKKEIFINLNNNEMIEYLIDLNNSILESVSKEEEEVIVEEKSFFKKNMVIIIIVLILLLLTGLYFMFSGKSSNDDFNMDF